MQFHRATKETCSQANGAVVVIDVIRAFTTAAYALAAGAREIVLTGSVEDAFALRRRFPQSLIMGEVGGLKVEGFDFGNSPVEIAKADLTGRRLIQRTGNGTQGMVRSTQARLLVAASFACAQATAAYLRRQQAQVVTFVVTGALPEENFASRTILHGDEDAACADYLETLMCGRQPDPRPYLERVRNALTAKQFLDPEQRDFDVADLDYCTRLNAFDFAMPVRRQDGLLILNRYL